MRRAGKTSNNFYSLYDAAMLSFTSYTKIGLRLAVFGGGFMCAGSVLASIICLILKAISPETLFLTGTAAIILTLLFCTGLVLFFIGFLGEYIMSINARVMKRPLVIEEERINFD